MEIVGSAESVGKEAKEIKSYFTEIPRNTGIFSCIGSRSWGAGSDSSDWNFVAITLSPLEELANHATGIPAFIQSKSMMANGGTLLSIPLASLPRLIHHQMPHILETLNSAMWVNPSLPELKQLVDMSNELVYRGTREFKMGTYSRISSLYMKYKASKDIKSLYNCVRIGSTYLTAMAGATYRTAMLLGGAALKDKTEEELNELAKTVISTVRASKPSSSKVYGAALIKEINDADAARRSRVNTLIHGAIIKGVDLWDYRTETL